MTKKLFFLTALFLAFACSKDDEQKDVDPIVGKWTTTNVTEYATITHKFEVKADGIMVMEHWGDANRDEVVSYGEKVGECLYVWKNLQTEKMERMLYKFSYCGYKGNGDAEWNRCDEIVDDFELLQWQYPYYTIFKWDITFNEDFSNGSGTHYYRANEGDDEITEYWGDLSKD